MKKSQLLKRLNQAVDEGMPLSEVRLAASIRGLDWDGVAAGEVRQISTQFRKGRRSTATEMTTAQPLVDLAKLAIAEAREQISELRKPPAPVVTAEDEPWVPKYGSIPVLRAGGRIVRVACRARSMQYLPGWRPGW